MAIVARLPRIMRCYKQSKRLSQESDSNSTFPHLVCTYDTFSNSQFMFLIYKSFVIGHLTSTSIISKMVPWLSTLVVLLAWNGVCLADDDDPCNPDYAPSDDPAKPFTLLSTVSGFFDAVTKNDKGDRKQLPVSLVQLAFFLPSHKNISEKSFGSLRKATSHWRWFFSDQCWYGYFWTKIRFRRIEVHEKHEERDAKT